MNLSISIYKMFFVILFLLSMFIGSIRTAIGPIRMDLLFDIIIILYLLCYLKKIDIKIIKMTVPFLFFIIYFIIWYPFNAKNLGLRDFLFIVIPIYTIITYYILSVIIQKVKLNFIYKFCSIYIIINFIISILQYINFLGINEILGQYFTMLAFNNGSEALNATKLTERTFGLTGNPTYLTFLSYLIFKLSANIKKSKIISILSLITIVISGGKMVQFFAIIWECYEFIYTHLKNNKNLAQLFFNILTITLFLTIFFISILLIIYNVPFLYNQVWGKIANGTFGDSYSYTYRFEMYKLLISSACSNIIFGGYSYEKFLMLGIDYVDSEYVMRILQYGIIGFLLLFYPLIHFCKEHKNNNYSLFLLFLCLAMALTNFSLTNYAFIFYIILYITVGNKFNEGNKYEQKNIIYMP